MSTEEQQKASYYGNLVRRAAGNPERSEHVVYATVTEFLLLHKVPPFRFVIHPQMSLKWKPDVHGDQRSEVPDIGLVNFSREALKLRCGVEVKKATSIMTKIPHPNTIKGNEDVKFAFHAARAQADDQAKAAFKNGYFFNSTHPIRWILVIGPYWTPVVLGPFSEAQLTVRSHKTSSSEDFVARVELDHIMQQPPPDIHELYRFGTSDSYRRLERILTDTDAAAAPLIDAILGIRDRQGGI